MRRPVESCPYRRVRVGGDSGQSETAAQPEEIACCGLLLEITGLDATAPGITETGDARCEVRRDACEACSESFPPSTTDINPVVAALLFNLTDELIAAGGGVGCELAEAQRLNAWAEKCLPILATPDETDSPSLPELAPSEVGGQVSLESVLPIPWSSDATARGAKNGGNDSTVDWAVGVTTAPRRLATIDTCLDSIEQAGWSDLRLFMDDPVDLAERHQRIPCSLRTPRLGAWPNYYLSLNELLMRDPRADAYLLLQDDVLMYGHPGLRSYLEKVWVPLREQASLVSLFCPRDYTRSDPGWHQLEETWFWGALAFIFSREAAQRFMIDRKVMSHRWQTDYGEGTKGIDVVIGDWAARNEVPVYYPSPSLVQHIGEVSTMWETARATGPRRAEAFLGDELPPDNS